MHPILRSRANALIYFGAWLPLGLMFGMVLWMWGHLSWTEAAAMTAPVTLILAFLCLSPWYACRSMPLGSTDARKLLVNHLFSALTASALLILVARGVDFAFSGVFPDLDQRFVPLLPLVACAAVLMYLLSIAFHYAMLGIETSRQAEVLAREAELRALKAQVNPHFLFNCLNSISALTAVDSARARDMCIRLADFLRASLRLGERAAITFGEELELTRTYLSVEQVRFGARLRVSESIEPECASCEVPPLLVQPLIENAVKHGIATLVEGGEISLQGRVSRDGVRFEIENPFDPDAPSDRRTGIGLRNVRDRLAARYGASAKLDITIEENRYRVTLWLPCAATAHAVAAAPSAIPASVSTS